MPDMKKPIENPELVAALAALHQENTPQNQGRVLELVLHHAVLLAPAVVTPPPQPQQDGEAVMEQKTSIQFQLITTKDGRPFFPAFTDWTELRKFCGPKQQQTVLLRFDDYVAMLQRNDKAHGFVINPMGLSLTLDRGTVMSLFKKKQEVLQRAQAKAAQGPAFTEETVEKDTQVMVGDPAQVPTAFWRRCASWPPSGRTSAPCGCARWSDRTGCRASSSWWTTPVTRPRCFRPSQKPPAPTAGSCLWT